MIKLLKDVIFKNDARREKLKKIISKEYLCGRFTRLEYDLLWDLVLDNPNLAEVYLLQALKEER